MLEAGVLFIGIVYLTATLLADILYTVLEPAHQAGDGRMTALDPSGPPSATESAADGSGRRPERRCGGCSRCLSWARSAASSCTSSLRSKTFIVGAVDLALVDRLRHLRDLVRPLRRHDHRTS